MWQKFLEDILIGYVFRNKYTWISKYIEGVEAIGCKME